MSSSDEQKRLEELEEYAERRRREAEAELEGYIAEIEAKEEAMYGPSVAPMPVAPMPVAPMPVAPQPVAPPPQVAPPPTAPSIDETAVAMPALNIDPLPFSQPEPDAPPPISQLPATGELPAGGAQSGETAFMSALSDLDEPLPFGQGDSDSDSDGLPDLSLEQYASLCVERALYPGNDLQVAERYKLLTAEALQKLDASWRKRFAAEGNLQARWQQAYSQYEAWLRGHK